MQSGLLILFAILLNFASSFPILYNHHSNSYEPSQSKIYAAYASLAYCPKKCLENWSCKTGLSYPKLTNVTHISNDITLAAVYIGYDEISQNIYISWRGSSNAENWISDFTIAMEAFEGCKGCYIHVGFHFDYHCNAKKLNNALDALIK